eukprot:SAG31_NODE_224_length_19856_cov_33.632890_13_plen_180_part_00
MMLLVSTLVSLGAAVCANPAVLRAPPGPAPFAGAGAHMASIFTDSAVLQMAPAVAAVYGVAIRGPDAPDASEAAAISIKITVTPEAHAEPAFAYSVTAGHVEVVNETHTHWKAVLRPTPGGSGSYTIEARCAGCGAATPPATIHNVVFGEVSVGQNHSSYLLYDAGPDNSDSVGVAMCR